MPKYLKWLFLLILLASRLSAATGWDPNTFTPDNAAYWYQKAFDRCEDPNGFDLDEYAAGDIELSPQIEKYLIHQQPVIDLLKKAAQTKHCDWQFEPLANGTFSLPPYLCDAKKAAYLLLANGRYQKLKNPDINLNILFEPILQLASAIDSDFLINHLTALALRATTYNQIHEYINRHPNWSLTDLYRMETFIVNEVKRPKLSYADTMNGEIKSAKRMLTEYKQYIYNDTFWTQVWGIPVEKLSEDFYKRNYLFFQDYMLRRETYLNLPYPEATEKCLQLKDDLRNRFKQYFADYTDIFQENRVYNENTQLLEDVKIELIEDCDFLFTVISDVDIPGIFSVDTKTNNYLNALQAGIKVLIRYRTTSHIPENMPFNSPKDLFSDKPFLIIKTADGFKLRCQGEDLSRSQIKKKADELDMKTPDTITFDNEIHEYEFTLPKD
jgi:hypothetical protein